jgi:signal transduction histidine kinase
MPNIEFDSRFLATMPPRVDAQDSSKGFHIPHGLSRIDWVNAQLTRTFIANASTALIAILLAVPLVLANLYGFLPNYILGAWLVSVAAFSAYRWWIVKSYRRRFAMSQARALDSFFMRHAWSWPASAMLWSGLVFGYLYRVPIENQFLCLVILIGMGAAAAGLMSSHLRICLLYLDGLCSLTFMAALIHVLSLEMSELKWHNVSLVLMVVLYWVLMRYMSKRFHTVQRRGFELQFDNAELITSLRERTQAAMDAVQTKNRLLANATHDLRQPVHALAFYADWLRNEPSLVSEVVPKILQATDSVNALFNSLFDFAKIESKGVTPRFVQMPICEMMNELSVQFGPSAQAKGLEMRLHINPAHVWTDQILIRRIVGNLLANAIRYTNNGAVLLSTRRRGTDMWIEVRDTGQGIAPEHQPHIFREFYKASTHEGTEDGFGLGLAIVSRLCDALGHEVVLHSTLGKGTMVRIIVPITKLVSPDQLLGASQA